MGLSTLPSGWVHTWLKPLYDWLKDEVVATVNALTDGPLARGGQTLLAKDLTLFGSATPGVAGTSAKGVSVFAFAHGSDLEVFGLVQVPSDYHGESVEITPIYCDDASGSDAVIEVTYERVIDAEVAQASDFTPSETAIPALVTMFGSSFIHYAALGFAGDGLTAGELMLVRFRRLGTHNDDGADALQLIGLGVQFTAATIR